MTSSFVQVPPDSTGKQIATNDIGGKQYQVVNIAAQDGAYITAHDVANQVTAGATGLVTNTVIHGRTTAGGGSYVDVKVNPSGALAVSVGDSALPTGAATDASVQAISKQRFASTKTLTYTGDNLTQVDEVIDGVTWRTTLTYSGSVLTGTSTVQL